MSPTLDFAFDLPPEAAVAFLRQKGLRKGFAWQDVWQEAHDQAFTVAKMMDTDLLGEVHEMVTRYIDEGRTTAEFVRDLEPELVRRGWWGRAEMVDPKTGETRVVQLGSPRRLRVIFETNVKASYAAGHWAEIEATADDAPYLMYDAIDDGRTRPEHAAWDGVVLRWDDPWWLTHYPPNGWNCRCGVIQLDADELAELGKDGPDEAPTVRTYEWTNPRTGETVRVPDGVDPGWAYHPGRTRSAEVRRVMAEKVAAAPPGLGAAAMASVWPRMAAEIEADYAAWVDEVVARGRARGEQRVIGALHPEVLQAMEARGIGVDTAAVTMADRVVLHMLREAKRSARKALPEEMVRRLPRVVAEPRAVLWDKRDPALLYVVDVPGEGRRGKVVVRVGFQEKVRTKGGERVRMRTNAVRTGGLVDESNLADPGRYEVLMKKP